MLKGLKKKKGESKNSRFLIGKKPVFKKKPLKFFCTIKSPKIKKATIP
jgi:hypothetical protein